MLSEGATDSLEAMAVDQDVRDQFILTDTTEVGDTSRTFQLGDQEVFRALGQTVILGVHFSSVLHTYPFDAQDCNPLVIP